MGLEPLRAEAKRTLGRGLQRATGAPSVGVALLGFAFAGFPAANPLAIRFAAAASPRPHRAAVDLDWSSWTDLLASNAETVASQRLSLWGGQLRKGSLCQNAGYP